jgi:hypothetical protein
LVKDSKGWPFEVGKRKLSFSAYIHLSNYNSSEKAMNKGNKEDTTIYKVVVITKISILSGLITKKFHLAGKIQEKAVRNRNV